MSEQPPPDRVPSNVRAIDRITGFELPIDLMFEGVDDEGIAHFRVVNLPEWFNPKTSTITADKMPPRTAIGMPVPQAAWKDMPPEALVSGIESLSRDVAASDFAGRCVALRSYIFQAAMWALLACFMVYVILEAFLPPPWGVMIVAGIFVVVAQGFGSERAITRIMAWRDKRDRSAE